MPVKTKIRRSHHRVRHKERRTKGFLKVYAPYIPLVLIVGLGITLGSHNEIRSSYSQVAGYATDTNDAGLLSETNKMRAAEGIPELSFNSKLDKAAQLKAQDMAAQNYWAHNTPEGKEPWVFIDMSEYKYAKAAENLAYGFEDSKSTVSAWMNSPGHRANLMDPELQEVGFGVIDIPNYLGKGPETVVVAMYGDPVGGQSAEVQITGASENQAAKESKDISLIQLFTDGKAPWSGFAVGLIIGSSIMYFAIVHVRGLKKTLERSERYVIKHPLFDITMVGLLILAFIAGQTVGSVY